MDGELHRNKHLEKAANNIGCLFPDNGKVIFNASYGNIWIKYSIWRMGD